MFDSVILARLYHSVHVKPVCDVPYMMHPLYYVSTVERSMKHNVVFPQPERIDPMKAECGYTIQSDVWSFGITLVSTCG